MDLSNMTVPQLELLRSKYEYYAKHGTGADYGEDGAVRQHSKDVVKVITWHIGDVTEAAANVIDHCEHGDDVEAALSKYARIAGCTKEVMRLTVNAKRAGAL
jgi:hypothetical protein